jgi:hypothetical protein
MMLSRRITASVSTAIRWPPANCTSSGGRSSSNASVAAGACASCASRLSSRAMSAREKSASNGGLAGRAMSSRLRPSDDT